MLYALCLVLFLVGLYGVLVKRNLIKIIISMVVLESGVNLFLVMLGYRKDGVAPIMMKTADPEAYHQAFVAASVDPVVQALVLTSIVIGLGVIALEVVIAMRLYEQYGTYDVNEIRRLRG
jgi:multisubunit Na+/H+ antiporter MnhC subunit